MRKLLKNHKGLTMVEVLVTVALLAIVIVPCLSSFVVAQRGNVLAEQTFDEYTKAANLMEELKGCEGGEALLTRLSMDYKVDGVQVNLTDGLRVVYYVHSTTDGNVSVLQYIELWIYVGEGDNQEISLEAVSNQTGYILRGVIAP
ncbi:MAG: prepilin-type N-terminal cleavage/methylation domain-containing protein [Clostridia bacterium]|nr:prepilin-type N-terminal cleavage/methylation domain-containing protein [Clostridia bacterium]